MSLAPRPPKGDPRLPDDSQVAGGGTSSDRLYDIATKVGGIERSATTLEGFASDAKGQLRDIEKEIAGFKPILSNLERCLERVESKLSKVQEDMLEVKVKMDTLKPIATSVGRGIWGVVLLLITFALSVVGMWVKHHWSL